MLAQNWGPVPGPKLPAPKAVLYACDHFRSALSCRPTSRDALKRPRRPATYHLNVIDVPQVRPSFFSSQASVAKIGVPPNRRRTVTCQDAMQARGRSWLEAAGLVLVRQRPGSAKGFMFLWRMRRGAANVVVWVKISREIPARASCFGHARRPRTRPGEEEVVHLFTHELTDLSAGLASVGNRKTPFPLPHGRGTRLITADRASIRAACRRARHRRCSMTISTLSSSRRVTSGSASGGHFSSMLCTLLSDPVNCRLAAGHPVPDPKCRRSQAQRLPAPF